MSRVEKTFIELQYENHAGGMRAGDHCICKAVGEHKSDLTTRFEVLSKIVEKPSPLFKATGYEYSKMNEECTKLIL